MQKRWLESNALHWDPWQAQSSAQVMYDKIFNMKFLPPGRGLWAMGSPLTEERHMFAALNNCAFVSTETMWDGRSCTPSRPFCFMMDAAMLGVGVGFDTKGATVAKQKGIVVQAPNPSKTSTYVIPDSREGWVEATRMLIDSYFDKSGIQQFDYSKIRPANVPIKGFGGLSAGPDPLVSLHNDIRRILDAHCGQPLTVTAIVDMMNLIGKCVVSGNVRRTAEIAFGDPHDDEYIDLKNYEKNPQRSDFGWTSNNSVFCQLGMDYSKVCERVRRNGEPGFAWLENAQKWGRMKGEPDYKDRRAKGGNPCLEQTLESYELCCLVEVFPMNHATLEEFLDTLQVAFLYAKTVTLGTTQWKESNAVMLRNRRIGTGLSGIAQFISKRGIDVLQHWCDVGYDHLQKVDEEVSEWFCVPKSVKTTTVKPSGTVSLLAGATPGMHYPESRYCIRRVRLAKGSELLEPLAEMGYYIEDDKVTPNTAVVEIPIDHGEGVRAGAEVSMWEQLSLAAFLQKWWSDNQVSCTVTFDPDREGPMLKYALEYFQYQLKGVSFLPRLDIGAYPQMPYEALTKERYEELISHISHALPMPTAPKSPRHAAIPTHAKREPPAYDRTRTYSVGGGGLQGRVGFGHLKSVETTDPEMERWCDTSVCVLDGDERETH